MRSKKAFREKEREKELLAKQSAMANTDFRKKRKRKGGCC